MIKELICINCPIGCRLSVTQNDAFEIVEVSGNTCARGEIYAKNEIINPKRMLTTTVKVQNSLHPLLPVITSAPLPKDKVVEVVKVCRNVILQSPITYNQVIIANVCELGVDILASNEALKIK